MGETSDEGKSREAATAGQQPVAQPSPYYYGTFQGVANYQPLPPQPVTGYPQPMPPSTAFQNPHPNHAINAGYPVAPWRPLIEHRLPCCGIGIGWFLFIVGFLCGAISWYIGVLILLCFHVDHREKPGLIACVLAAALAVIAVTLGVTKVNHD